MILSKKFKNICQIRFSKERGYKSGKSCSQFLSDLKGHSFAFLENWKIAAQRKRMIHQMLFLNKTTNLHILSMCFPLHSKKQQEAISHNHSSQITVSFSNAPISLNGLTKSGRKEVILQSLGNRQVCKSLCSF